MMTPTTHNRQPSLINKILEYGELAFDSPAEKLRCQNMKNYRSLIESTPTLILLPVLNQLVQPGRVTEKLRKEIISTLARMPLRVGGVQDTISFILSIHPSTANVNTTSVDRNSCVTHEALNVISGILSFPPSTISAEDWFNGIAPQLLFLLQGDGGHDIGKVVAYVIGFGILGRRQYGSPGSSGWKAIVEPIYEHISPSNSAIRNKGLNPISPDSIEYVGLRRLLSTPLNLASSLKRLSSLATSHPHPSLANRVLRPILYSLWTLSCWPNGNDSTEKLYRNPARKLLKTLLHLSRKTEEHSSKSLLSSILHECICERQSETELRGWKFVPVADGEIQIEKFIQTDETISKFDLLNIDTAIDYFVRLIRENLEMNSEVSVLFTRLGSRWLTQDSEEDHSVYIDSYQKSIDQHENERVQLIELRVMQKMIISFPEKLIENSKQLLDFTYQILRHLNESKNIENKDDIISIALSLLNITFTSDSFRITADNRPLCEMIERALESLISHNFQETSRTAKNILMLIRLRDTINLPELSRSPKEISRMDQQLEDKKSYSLAMSYLTESESYPPVRVQGLELLSNLLEANSPILDIPNFVLLLSSLLADNEEYVHLRVIRLLVQVSHKHPKTTVRSIIDRYVDPNEECELDQRLRLGEALHQVIQSNNSSLKNFEIVDFVCEGLLFIGSRRGSRPKTKERQEKAILLKKEQDLEAEKEWGGPIPQSGEAHDCIEAKDLDVDIDCQIVSGWESSRDTEDVRIRSSAVTILGTAIMTNLQDIKPSTISAVLDLSLHILTLEREIEKAILRRAAVFLIMNFIQALDSARTEKNEGNLRFGLADHGLVDMRRIIEYVERTDNDNLVRQHSRDVIESLESWSLVDSLILQRQSARIQKNIIGLPVISTASSTLSNNKSKIVEVE